MNKLAIDGGNPVFQQGELAKLVPAWPPAYPETDQKLLEVYHSGKWGLCGKYEQLLMEEFAAFQDAKYSVWMCNGTTTLECALLALEVGPEMKSSFRASPGSPRPKPPSMSAPPR